jgi:hypothetical protein
VIALTPQLVALTTGVGAVMILGGAQARTAPASQSAPQVSVLRPADRRPRLQALHREHALIFGISAWALSTIAAAVVAWDRSLTMVSPVPNASVS